MAPKPGYTNFSPDRARMARFRAGLSVRDLADRVGVSHAAVSQFETGRATPTEATTKKIALATGVPLEYLTFGLRPVSLGALDGTHFRSLRSTTKGARARAWVWAESVLDLATVLEDYVRLPAVDLPLAPLHPASSEYDIEDAVEQLREAWRLPIGPVGHLVRNLERHGVVVARLDLDDEGIDAFSHNQGDRPVIVLGSNKADIARSRFDAAHELGHLVCHAEADPGGTNEKQAHAFAAELLMPRRAILPLLPRRFDLGSYARLKQEWGVSIAALVYRARTLEVISDSAYRRAVVQLNADFGRTREPYPVTRPDEPAMLATAATMLIDMGMSLPDLASRARLSEADVRVIIGDHVVRPEVRL